MIWTIWSELLKTLNIGKGHTNEGWAKIVGPDSLEGRLAKRRGNPLPEMPAAENIQVKAHKTESGVKRCSQKY